MAGKAPGDYFQPLSENEEYADGDGMIDPYAGFGYTEPDGSQMLKKTPDHPTPNENLTGYGTQDDSADFFDHELNYGHAMRPTFANDHTRATAAGKPDVEGGEDSCDPFDTVPGLGGSPWQPGRSPVKRRPGSTTQRP